MSNQFLVRAEGYASRCSMSDRQCKMTPRMTIAEAEFIAASLMRMLKTHGTEAYYTESEMLVTQLWSGSLSFNVPVEASWYLGQALGLHALCENGIYRHTRLDSDIPVLLRIAHASMLQVITCLSKHQQGSAA